MKRNVLIVAGIFLLIIGLMVTGNVIIVGEKIAHLTHLWWMEYVFYGLLLLLVGYYLLMPMWRIHTAPPFPVMAVTEGGTCEELQSFGDKLAAHCDYIPDSELRKQHHATLKRQLLEASGSRQQLAEIVRTELDLRFKGDKQLGVLGINTRIKEWAKTVFMVSAISQNSRFDTVSVMYMNYRLIEDLIVATGFRPSYRQLWRMYASILTTALITYAMSEALAGAGSVAPFDFGDIGDAASDTMDVDNFDPDDAAFSAQVDDTQGLTVYSILRRLKIPGVVVSSGIDGAVNALMTLRIGYVTRAYLQRGAKGLSGVKNKRAVKIQAMKDALVDMPAIVASGSGIVGKKTTNFILKLMKREYKF